MADPEVYLRDMAAPLAGVREGDPLPVVRFSVEAVANAFVVLGLLPAARAGEILAAQRPALEAAGFRVGREIGELSVGDGARTLQEARGVGADSLQSIPLAATGSVRGQLRDHQLVISDATLTPEGIRVRYHGEAREMSRAEMRAVGDEVTERIKELSVTDDSGGRYLVPTDHAHGHMSGQRSASGGTLWGAEGEFLAVPAQAVSADRPAIGWLEFAAGSSPPVRVRVPPPAPVPTGTTEPPWPTPAECYLAQLPPPAADWSIGSFETGSVDFDTAGIMAAVADGLLAVGALPQDSAMLAGFPGRVHSDWRLTLSERQLTLMHHEWAAPERTSRAGLAVRLPFKQAIAVIESITAREDLVSVQLYGHPWVVDGAWPMITPCFRVTAIDDTGVRYEGEPGNGSTSTSTHEGSHAFWFSPPVDARAKQLRVTVSTLWEAAWALIDIPGR